MSRQMSNRGTWRTTALAWAGVLIVCGGPAAWAVGGLVLTPAAWGEMARDGAMTVHTRTLLLATASVLVACVAAIGPAMIARRRRLPVVAALGLATLAVPEAAWSYGVAEAWRYGFGSPTPDSWADWARAALTVAAQAWPVPAAALAVARSRLPAGVLEAADLDGGRRRVTISLLGPPLLAGGGIALLLAGRQVTAYDQTGIVVTGVLVRETWTAPTAAGRAAAAGAAGLPLYAILAVIACVSAWALWRRAGEMAGAEDDSTSRRTAGSRGARPAILSVNQVRSAGRAPRLLPSAGVSGMTRAILMVPALVLTLAPVLALLHTAGGPGAVVTAYADNAPQLHKGLLHAALAAGVAALQMMPALIAPARGVWLAAAGAFLVGGQLLALGLLRLVNAPPLGPPAVNAAQDALAAAAYDTPLLFAWAPAALFAFVPLAAARATWGGRLLAYRELAAADGATAAQAARHVALPIAWPGLLAAVAAAFALSLGETHAAVLLYPDSLVNVMMTNVHTLAFAPMAAAALLGATAAAGAALFASAAVAMQIRKKDEGRRKNGRIRFRLGFFLLPSSFILSALFLSACDRPDPPEAVWSSLGTGDGQLVYPRAAAYSAADDAVYVVDRTARVQRFDAETGDFEAGWRMPDFRYGKPVGLGVDPAGDVWVPDTHYGRVIVYSPDGVELFRFGESGTGPGQFVWPTDVLHLPDGRVLVSEYGAGETGNNDRIQVFRRVDGEMVAEGEIGAFGTGPGQFRRPQSMARVGDVLWVADAANHRLLAFSLRDGDLGTFLRAIGDGGASDLPGRFRFPYGVEADAEGDLIVAEFGNNRVQKIDPATGESLGIWGAFGPRPGRVRYPWALAHDPARGRTAVVDSGNDRVQIIDF